MNAFEYIRVHGWLSHTILACCVILASIALYFGLGYYTLIGSRPDQFLDWFWPLCCLVVFALALTGATFLVHRVYGRGLSSAFFFSLSAIFAVAVALGVVFALLASLRPVK
jgi:hypothetical protein